MTIRFAGIGFAHDHLAQFLCDGVLRHDETELVAIADTDPRRLQAARGLFDVESFSAVDAVLKRDDIDAVAVAAPNNRRPALITKALRAGKHVISDKPLAISDLGLGKIRAALRRSRRRLSLLLTERFTEPYVLLHEIVSAGRIGRVVCILSSNPHVLNGDRRPDWMWKPRQYGDIIRDLLVHRVDLVRWITGQEIASSTALTSAFGVSAHPAFQDAASALLLLKDDSQALLHTSWTVPSGARPHGHFTVYGLKGSAAVTQDGKLLVTTAEGSETLSRKGENPNFLICEDFVQLIKGGCSRLSARDALAATAAALAIRRSILGR